VALNALAEHTVLSPEQLKFVEDNGYVLELKNCCNGTLFRSLDPRKQMQLLLSDPYSIPHFFRRLYNILPSLEEEDLVTVAAFFDPLNDNLSSSKLETYNPLVQADFSVSNFIMAVLKLRTGSPCGS
jgi:hypothetical protein